MTRNVPGLIERIDLMMQETILWLEIYPNNHCTIIPARHTLFNQKDRIITFQETIARITKIINEIKEVENLENADSLALYGSFEDQLRTLSTLKNKKIPTLNDERHLECIKKGVADIVIKEITTSLKTTKKIIERPFKTEEYYLRQTIEADLFCYQDEILYSKKITTNDINNYSDYINHLQRFANRFSRKIYCSSIPEIAAHDADSSMYCAQWTEELLSFEEKIKIHTLTEADKKRLLQIKAEQMREHQRALEDSLNAIKKRQDPALEKYNFLRQSSDYIIGEIVLDHILLNETINQNPSKKLIFKQLLECGLISTPNALITFLDAFPWETEEDIDYCLSMIFAPSYLYRVSCVHEEKNFSISIRAHHSNLSAIIQKIAIVTQKDYLELINAFVECNPQYISLLTLQYHELLMTIPSAAIETEANKVYSSLETLYYNLNHYSDHAKDTQQIELVSSYFYYTNQLLLSKPNTPERKQLLKKYEQLTLQAKGKPSREWQLVGAAMLGLSACLLGFHLVVIPSVIMSLIGLSIFSAASVRTNSSQKMLNFHDLLCNM